MTFGLFSFCSLEMVLRIHVWISLNSSTLLLLASLRTTPTPMILGSYWQIARFSLLPTSMKHSLELSCPAADQFSVFPKGTQSLSSTSRRAASSQDSPSLDSLVTKCFEIRQSLFKVCLTLSELLHLSFKLYVKRKFLYYRFPTGSDISLICWLH